MAAVPVTRYALFDGAHIAYQVFGSGPDLLMVPSTQHPIDLLWDEARLAAHLRRLASFSRMILIDPLGTGSSDPVSPAEYPAMQTWTDSFVAVLNAVGSEQATVFGHTGTGLGAMMVAATHPDRVRSLILWNTYARFIRAQDYPIGLPEKALQRYIDSYLGLLGTGAFMDLMAPSWANDAATRRWWAKCERLTSGPGLFESTLDYWLRTDVRAALESIQAPTVIMRRRDDRGVRRGHALYLLEHIAHARLIEFDGEDHFWFVGDADPVIDEIESFVTGQRTGKTSNRTLSTVMFTDIVDSTRRATTLGDNAWSAVLAQHDRLVEQLVADGRGRVIKSTGDGALAIFDGPARAIECACAIGDAVRGLGLHIRTGLHTGEVEIVDGDIRGIAVHVAARIMGLASADEVLVSGVMPPLVLGSGIEFDDRGMHELKGVPGSWPVFAVRG